MGNHHKKDPDPIEKILIAGVGIVVGLAILFLAITLGILD